MRLGAALFPLLLLPTLAACGVGSPVAGLTPGTRATPLPASAPVGRPPATPRASPTPSATAVAKVLPPADFGFIFTYGMCVDSTVDTFAGTFHRAGESVDPPVTVSLSLTTDDLQRIRRAVDEIDYFSYPAEFTLKPRFGPITAHTPSNHYRFAIREGARQHSVFWNDDIDGVSSRQADDLRALADLIERTVHGVPAVAALPPLHVGCA
jgi:hypothetical protein